MRNYLAFIISCFLVDLCCGLVLDFPPGFEFGAATSAYQIEGAWNTSDKGKNIWDSFVHERPDLIADGSTGDVACNSYHLWRRDVEMAAQLGLQFYRFSISWSRLLPTGLPHIISEDGKRYYNDLIDTLLEKGIKPMVTLYHFDLPQRIQDLGGWTNPLISDWFADYARVAFHLFGDRVPTWLTINEPLIFCHTAHDSAIMAPAVKDPIATYLCAKHALVSHAKAWRVYDEEFRDKFHGKISICNQILWLEAKTPDDEEYAEIARQFGGGLYSHPIFSKEGGWPPLIEKLIAEKSQREGFPFSKLPPFTKEEKRLVRGTYDFFGVNFYISRVVRKAEPGELVDYWPLGGLPEFHIALDTRPDWEHPGGSLWFYTYTPGFRKMLNWVKDEYGDVEIAITENGYPEGTQNLEDNNRIKVLRDNLEQVLLAIKEDGINVSKFTVWSLLDNFEWISGYTSRFGLFEVNFTSPIRERIPRKSAHFYADVIRTHSLSVSGKDEL